ILTVITPFPGFFVEKSVENVEKGLIFPIFTKKKIIFSKGGFPLDKILSCFSHMRIYITFPEETAILCRFSDV
ncbi:MAG: hypothetical protein IIX70_07945, partial [Oscillospiraceae bacterium]|nr:hypothetical protein [Oscillospiraceae bacterium]